MGNYDAALRGYDVHGQKGLGLKIASTASTGSLFTHLIIKIRLTPWDSSLPSVVPFNDIASRLVNYCALILPSAMRMEIIIIAV